MSRLILKLKNDYIDCLHFAFSLSLFLSRENQVILLCREMCDIFDGYSL